MPSTYILKRQIAFDCDDTNYGREVQAETPCWRTQPINHLWLTAISTGLDNWNFIKCSSHPLPHCNPYAEKWKMTRRSKIWNCFLTIRLLHCLDHQGFRAESWAFGCRAPISHSPVPQGNNCQLCVRMCVMKKENCSLRDKKNCPLHAFKVFVEHY